MHGSTLAIVAVLFFGAVFIVTLGCLNPFVPKRYRRMVKNVYKTHGHGGGDEIPVFVRYDSIFYLVISVLIIMASTIVYLLVRYPSVEAFFERNGIDIIMSVFVWAMLAVVMELFYVIAAFLAETMVIQSLEHYYEKFGFKVVDVRIKK